MFGNGILNTDGAEWKARRALIRPFFGNFPLNIHLNLVDNNNALFFLSARERITDYGHFDMCSNKVIQLFKERADAGESIDVQDVFARFTIDMAGK